MATTAIDGNPVQTVGELPAVGTKAPEFTLTDTGLGDLTSASLAGRRVVLNIFPSVDTGVCADSVRKFNELAAGLENTTVVCASKDLPFALARFCGAEGLENVVAASAFRSSFGEDFGLTQADGPLRGLLARTVIVLDEEGKVIYSQLVDEIKTEPNYDAAIAALS
ncbi:thiol peroxidase [Glutamicibacter uratoxydans]|uniref:thiol peroxidase n=1 Tax=Glutamicibacter uratoxydans TaxID=43667 RepID=UPI003D6F6298